MNKCLFLDRDGVINYDYGYVHDKNSFVFQSDIFELVRFAKKHSYLVIVVTNQAGIGRGYYSEADFHSLTSWMINQFEIEGCSLDKVHFCPCHPIRGVGKYKRDCKNRKPMPGMINHALESFEINAANSLLIGDNMSDIEAGYSAGIGSLYLLDPQIKAIQSSKQSLPPHTVVQSLLEIKNLMNLEL